MSCWPSKEALVSRHKVFAFVLDHLIWFVLLLVLLFFVAYIPGYLSPTNAINILLHASVLGLLTIGQALVLISGNFDLSLEGTVSLLTVLAAVWMLPQKLTTMAEGGGNGWELHPLIVIPIMLLLGALIGLVNGTMVARLKMNTFIVTLAMQLILRGIAFVISQGAYLTGTPTLYNWLGSGQIASIPISVIFTLLMFIFVAYFLTNSIFGRRLYAVGGNKEAARASGFNNKKVIIIGYMISGLMAALASWMLQGRLQVSMSNLGVGMTLETVAAAVIGGIALSGGSGTIAGAFAGVLLISLIDHGLNLMQVDPFYINAVRGAIILIAVFIEAQKLRFRPGVSRHRIATTQPGKD
jgi:ribose/xylose/arabinose/galactoside ABC-type transport system permease subunit